MTTTFRPTAGRFTLDRYDFNKHLDGTSFRHQAGQIDLYPPISFYGTQTNVQDAITTIIAHLTPYIVPDADATTKGIVQLAGDISGSATSLRVSGLYGYPVTIATTPTTNYVLTWDGYIWKPMATQNSFTAAGDLTGTNTSQQVIAATGYSTNFSIKCDNMSFINTASPNIYQENTSTGNGQDFFVSAQTSTAASSTGGNLILGSGIGTLNYGSVLLALGVSANIMLEATQISTTSNRVLSLVNPSSITSTNMPAGTGDMVMFIKNAVTNPSTGLPVGGAILYASGGALNIKESGGNDFPITENRLVDYDSVAVSFGGDYSTYDSTTSLTYEDITSMTLTFGSIPLTVGDRVRAHFHGHFKHNDGYGGFIRLSIWDGYSTYEIPGTEVILDDAVNTTQLMSMSGEYTMTVTSNDIEINAQFKTLYASDVMYVYKGISLMAEVYR